MDHRGPLALEREFNDLKFPFNEQEWDQLFAYEQTHIDHVIELGVLVRSFGLKTLAAGFINEEGLAKFLGNLFSMVVDEIPPPRRAGDLHERLNRWRNPTGSATRSQVSPPGRGKRPSASTTLRLPV
ncbi:hypothetical protein BH24ACT26_BH24ACT26_18110 [soil metagenome]